MQKRKYTISMADMGRRPKDGFTIERKDNNSGYDPGNCRWASRQDQSMNTSNVHLITIDGITLTRRQWAIRRGINYQTVVGRINRGVSPEAALS